MEKEKFFTVHKDFAQAGPIYGHEEFFGLSENAAKAKYHEMLASAYNASDPWTHVFLLDDSGAVLMWEIIDRRTTPEPNAE